MIFLTGFIPSLQDQRHYSDRYLIALLMFFTSIWLAFSTWIDSKHPDSVRSVTRKEEESILRSSLVLETVKHRTATR